MKTSDSASLKRSLNTPLLTLYGLGVTVGAGIYVLIGEAAGQAGPFAWVAFGLAAMVVAFTALSYTELSTRYPISAGESVFVEKGFNSPDLARIVGLLVAASGMVSAAAIAVGASGYVAGLTGQEQAVFVAPIVIVMGLLAVWGITQSVWVASLITVIEVLGLCFVIYWGFGQAEPAGIAAADLVPGWVWQDWSGILTATILAFFAFVGFEDMVNVAEEVKEPRRTLPKAILITLIVATALYIGTCLAVLWSVPIAKLDGSAEPLALVFDNAPQSVRTGFSALAVVATINGVLIQIIMSSRIFYGMANRGNFPAAFGRIWQRTRTPHVATGTVTLVILGLATLLPIGQLAQWTSQIVLTVFVFVNCALVAIKLRGDTSQSDHFKTPIAIPVIGASTSALLLLASAL